MIGFQAFPDHAAATFHFGPIINRKTMQQRPFPAIDVGENLDIVEDDDADPTGSVPGVLPRRYPGRTRKPPDYYGPWIQHQ